MNTEKPQFDYFNFDLLIEREGDAYLARVTNSPAGEAATRFSVPFAALELENFLLKIGRPRRGVRRLNSPEMEAAKKFGKRLFDSVFGSEVFGCLRSSLDQAEAKGSAGLRLRLRLNAPELADLPWEYLYNSALNRFLVLAVETPLVRYIELPERIRPLAVQPPLKILVMISDLTDYPPLNVEEEWTKLQNALGDLQKRKLVALERLDEATLPALQRRLRQSSYHIFHFIGHGGYDESARDGILLLEDETNHSRKVSGQFLGTILHNHRPLRLAVLNACEGARASRTDPFTGAAQSLVQQGLPAVIAMQFEITDAAAITFSHEFYTALADGYPVDAALVEARAAIFASGNDVEWGTPVLYMRAPDGKIFDIDRTQPAATPIRETPKPKTAPPPEPVVEKKKPSASPQPPSKAPRSSRNAWLLSGIALLLVVLAWQIYQNIDWGQSTNGEKFMLAYVTIEVQPADAEVILDGETLPTSNRRNLPLSLGLHTLNLSGAGYKPKPIQFRLDAPRDTTLRYALDAEPVETKIIRSPTLRATRRDDLTEGEVKSMLITKGLFDSDWNKDGSGFANDYELRTIGADQVVVDKSTGLMWQRGGSSNRMTYEDVGKYILGLNKGTERGGVGYTDWRLPTLEEAMSLMESRKLNSDLYLDLKFDKTQRYIWTTDKPSAGEVWVVYFGIGSRYNVVSYFSYVRAVRSVK